MALMYDTIMELPLFKGIGEEQLSLMLEKTSVEFLKFKDGEIIADPSTQVKGVDFIIAGKVKNVYKMENFPIEIEEILGKGNMIGALHLYGLDTHHVSQSIAIGEVSLMRVEKSQYMNILLSDRIYILNFVNYLSAAAQKPEKIMLNQGNASIKRTLDNLAYSLVSRRAESVNVKGNDQALAAYCGVSVEEIQAYRKNKTKE